MKTKLYYLLAIVILQGCASAKLKVEVDLFDQDPADHLILSPSQVDAILHNAVSIQLSAEQMFADDKKWINNAQKALFLGWNQAKEPSSTNDESCPNISNEPVRACLESTDGLADKLEKLKVNIDDLTREIKTLDSKIDEYLETYSKALKQAKNLDVYNKNQHVPTLSDQCAGSHKHANHKKHVYKRPQTHHHHHNYCARSNSYTHDKDKDLSKLRELDTDKSSSLAALRQKKMEIEQIANKVVKLYQAYSRIDPPSLDIKKLAILFSAQIKAINDQAQIARLNKVIGDLQGRLQQLSNYKNEENLSNTDNTTLQYTYTRVRQQAFDQSAVQTIQNLAKGNARYLEQIDRLQNIGDPAWRIISDPRNEQHWNKRFAQTFFKAEGNASIVVVRDSPIHFRAYHATNDPSGLIEGQLNIARAIGDAAISIAGANIGLQRSQSAPAQDQTLSQLPFANLGDGSINKNLMVLEKQNQIKDKAIILFIERLKGLQIRLEQQQAADDNSQEIEAIKNQLKALASSYQAIFSSEINLSNNNNQQGQ